jgi:hypothetical protein
MDRRTALKGLFGAAVVAAAGGSIFAASEAEAAVPMPGGLGLPDADAAPAVATPSDLLDARPENVQWVRRCWIDRWGYRRCVARPVRRVTFVTPGFRRRRACWINRWGQRVCRW